MVSSWREVFLEDVAAELTVGFVGSMRSEYVDSGIPFLRSKNIDPYVIRWNDMRFISREFHDRIKKSALAPGDVVIVRTGTPGTATLIPKSLPEANCSDVVIVRPGPQLDARYLVYYLNSAAVHHINSQLVGAARKLQINLPLLPEQKAIAQVLSSLDDKIDLLHRQNKTLEAIAETLFRQWFIGEAQNDWDEKSLLDVIQVINGGTPKTSMPEYWNGEIPWLSGGDITSSHKSFVISSAKTITQKGLDHSSAKLLPKFATVITARGTVGKYALLSKPIAYSQSNFGILPRIKDCFFFTYLLINHVVRELQSASYGSGYCWPIKFLCTRPLPKL